MWNELHGDLDIKPVAGKALPKPIAIGPGWPVRVRQQLDSLPDADPEQVLDFLGLDVRVLEHVVQGGDRSVRTAGASSARSRRPPHR